MSNAYIELRNEIARIARKEVRREVEVLKKTVAQQRSHIAQQRKLLESLQRELKRLDKATKGDAPASGGRIDDGEPAHRFRAGGVASMRKRMGLSAKDLGKLVGVSGLSIYNWEGGKSRPRPRQLEALSAVRGIGKKEAAARLEALDAATLPTKRRGNKAGRKAA